MGSEMCIRDRSVLDRLAELGISYPEVVDTLEREGVAKFEMAWESLLADVTAGLESAS